MESNDWVELYRAGLYGILAIIGGAVSYICNAEEFSIIILSAMQKGDWNEKETLTGRSRIF